MWWPFKKKTSVKKEEIDDSVASAPVDGSSSLAPKVMQLETEITKISALLDSVKDFRLSTGERFSAINEEIGELRGYVNETNKTMGEVEVKTIRAVDMVEAVQPDKLMISVQKLDAKIEALKANLEGNEEMMKMIKDQMSKMRSQIMVFRGTEQVIKLNEETKNELMDVKKVSAITEQHADRVESIFGEMQKTYKMVNDFMAEIETLKEDLKDAQSKIESEEVKSKTFITSKEFEGRITKIEAEEKKRKDLVKSLADASSKLDVTLKKTEHKLRDDFGKDMNKAKLLSDAFDRTLADNPMFAKGLGLDKYIKSKMKDMPEEEKPEEKKEEPAGEEKKDGEEKK